MHAVHCGPSDRSHGVLTYSPLWLLQLWRRRFKSDLNMEIPRVPLPLFSAQIEIQKCIEIFIRNAKRNICFSFSLETNCYKVNYSQKSTKKDKRPRRTFCHNYSDPDKENDDMYEDPRWVPSPTPYHPPRRHPFPAPCHSVPTPVNHRPKKLPRK